MYGRYAALVVPAFQLDLAPPAPGDEDAAAGFFEANFDRVPTTTSELRNCVASKQCSTFYSKSSPETHATSNGLSIASSPAESKST